MPIPRRAPAVGAPIPCSAYTLERKMLRAYEALYQREIGSIWHLATRKAKAVQVLGGKLADTQVRGAEQRLREAMPELIRRLTLEQQPQIAALLLCEAPNLPTVVAELARLERNLNYRDYDPRLNIADDSRLRAASMGWLSKQQYTSKPPRGQHLPTAAARVLC